jgi:hypothetical protein
VGAATGCPEAPSVFSAAMPPCLLFVFKAQGWPWGGRLPTPPPYDFMPTDLAGLPPMTTRSSFPTTFVTTFAVAALGSFLVSFLGGCAAPSAEDLDTSEAAATPANPRTHFELALTCSRMLKRHETVRPIDMQQGVIRWGCGDVPGVTNEDLGQEYCEYQVVQNGAIKRKAADVASDAPVSCVFTSVFQDAGAEARLQAAMADPQNLGAAAATSGVVQMQKQFNSRGAATALIRDCQAAGDKYPLEQRLRTAACSQAVARTGATRASELATVCKTNLMTGPGWARAQELGAKIAEPGSDGYEEQRDIASCMAVAAAGGVMWRNSDPMICARTSRSTTECDCSFGAVPDKLEGLPFTGWVDDQIPTGCRFAKVDGADYPYVVICPVSDQETADLAFNPVYAGNLGNFCRDRFATDLVMKLPVRALQTEGTCQHTAGFCADYMGSPPVEPKPTEPAPTPAPTPANRTTNRADGAPHRP